MHQQHGFVSLLFSVSHYFPVLVVWFVAIFDKLLLLHFVHCEKRGQECGLRLSARSYETKCTYLRLVHYIVYILWSTFRLGSCTLMTAKKTSFLPAVVCIFAFMFKQVSIISNWNLPTVTFCNLSKSYSLAKCVLWLVTLFGSKCIERWPRMFGDVSNWRWWRYNTVQYFHL